jgi:hypothetical protein
VLALHFPMRLERPMRGHQGPWTPTRCRTGMPVLRVVGYAVYVQLLPYRRPNKSARPNTGPVDTMYLDVASLSETIFVENTAGQGRSNTMGQYYVAVILGARGLPAEQIRAWASSYDWNCGAKLMEHSWIGSRFVEVVMHHLGAHWCRAQESRRVGRRLRRRGA